MIEKNIKILFIGGSNFVLMQGITEKLPSFLAMAGINIDSVSNIAVGGTGSLFGLENLTNYLDFERDVVFIEYGINDLPTYSRDKALWEQGFSSLLKLTRKRYPSALIVTILLGRRDEKFWPTQARMYADMIRLSSDHGAKVINIDALFKSKIFNNISFELLYADESHYREPLVVGYIAQQCALACIGFMKVHKKLLNIDLVPKLVHNSLELTLTPISGESRRFSNSRFFRDTNLLEINNSLVIDVPGIPIGLSFVSIKESCSVRIDFLNKSKIINTLQRPVFLEQYKFIVKHVPLLRVWNPEATIPKSTRVELHAIDAQSSLWSDSLVQKTFGMIEPSPLAAGINLCAISSWVPAKT